MKEKLITR